MCLWRKITLFFLMLYRTIFESLRQMWIRVTTRPYRMLYIIRDLKMVGFCFAVIIVIGGIVVYQSEIWTRLNELKNG
ncbi:hypothetical protein Zmor_028029 [Zophobas morio]|uniref:Uncharacterized protein n=1 Tax=Zophobas morio TaxID=2755281 RepID=A0AA38HQ58_9CUCU|nr:hypothetical protein Zmor_028029 [Zophobas morio]